MKKLLILLLFVSISSCAQDGKIISKKPLIISDSIKIRLAKSVPDLGSVKFSKITYLSDGLKVTGYIAEPKKKASILVSFPTVAAIEALESKRL